MKARSTTLASGVVWAIPKESKDKVPLNFKLAATNLAEEFHRVNITHWDSITFALGIEVFRDEDVLNPNRYDIIKRGGVFYRKENRAGGTLWPVYKERDKQVSPEAARPRAAIRRQRHPAGEVREDGLSIHTHSIFAERAEVRDDLKIEELKWERNPTIQGVMAMKVLRDRMAQVEMRIVAAAIAEQAVKDLAS